MTTYVCSNCGERNAPGTTFCVNCHAFLAWDEVEVQSPPVSGGTRLPDSLAEDEAGSHTVIPARVNPSAAASIGSSPLAGGTRVPGPESDQADVEGRLQVTAEQKALTVPATGELATLTVQVMNTSTIVDGYGVDAPGAPPWLVVESDPIHLLPGTEDAQAVRLRIKRIESNKLVPAQKIDVTLRVHSTTQDGVQQQVPIEITVPIVDVPVQLRAEPRLLRVRDTDASRCKIVIDNSRSNGPMQLRFSGSDSEEAVKFEFDPPIVSVGPGGSGSVAVALTAARPEPGQELTRQLTITANDGTRNIETAVTLQQATSVRVEDPPVTLEAMPSLVRVRDSTTGWARIGADNRGGSKWAHLQFKASDPEEVVHVSWSGAELHVPPGRTGYMDAQFEAPLPDAGTEASRAITVTATDGRRVSTTTVTFVQAASVSPMTTLALRLEPSVVRVQDVDSAAMQLLVDNQHGRSGVRVYLGGSDPERAVRFTFSQPVIDVAAGQVQVVGLRLDSWRPPPGQEWTRQLTVTATDGQATVETSGSLAQASSRAAIELLGVRVDPSVLRLPDRTKGRVAAVVDNRNGAQPIRVSLRGDDPENVVRFTFTPAVLDIPPGRVATSVVRVRAPRPRGGTQVTRPFTIMATDGRSETQANGSMIQSSASLRPIARAVCTLLGGLAMILGAFQAWRAAAPDQAAVDINALDLLRLINKLPGFGDRGIDPRVPDLVISLASPGLLFAALGVVVIFGLTGRSGRLTRVAAILGALVLVATLLLFAFAGEGGTPAPGWWLALIGCITGFVGGLLIKR